MANEAPDPEQLELSEATDEDELGVDPLDRGVDLAEQEGYLGADRYGMTAEEQATPRPLNSRLAEELPDRLDADRAQSDSDGYVPVVDETEGDIYREDITGYVVREPDDPANDETVHVQQP